MGNEEVIKEIRYQVGEAWKGEYNADTLYSVAAVVQDPTGLSVYRSLKDGNVGHALTDSTWWFKIIDMSSIKNASDVIVALNEAIAADEAARVLAEAGRVSAEQGRVSAESGRVSAESGRVSAEGGRVSAEGSRVGAESGRVSAESSRVSAESGRVTAEAGRVAAERLRDTAEGERATAENNRAAAETERHTQYTTDHGNATSDHSTAVSDHATAAADHTQASNDHTASTAATEKANNVNATIDGMTVTITDKNGVSTSVNIGFDIAGTYASVAAMNADAANVQEGAFVMIATTDTTSTENARLYVRNSTAPTSSEPFTFLSDLDQAATSAWADWMENYKPTIEADHTTATNDHTQATTDHGTAASDHTQAASDHTLASTDHSTASSDHTTAASDHTTAGTDHSTAAADHTQAESDHQRAETDHNTMEPRISNLEESKANKDGYYSQMTVGAAETLVGETVDSEAYLIRPTGGESNEVANGVASVLGMEGNSCVWNQTFPLIDTTTISDVIFTRNSNGSYTVTGTNTSSSNIYNTSNTNFTAISGHKYYYRIIGNSNVGYNAYSDPVCLTTGGIQYSSAIYTATNSGRVMLRLGVAGNVTNINETVNVILIDLTLLGIDNLTTVVEVEAWLAEHVGTKPYYAYNAGTILSAQTLGIKTYGQNLLNSTTRQAKLIPYEWEDNSNVYTIKNVPSGATATFTPDATGVAETVDISGGSLDITSYGSGILELSAATADTYVCMKWDEQKDNDVVPYEDHTYDFDVRKVYGKASGAGEYVQCFQNGMKSAGTIQDILTASEAVVKIGDVNLGTLDWRYTDSLNCFFVTGMSAKTDAELICVKYLKGPVESTSPSGYIGFYNNGTILRIKDTSYGTDAITFKSAMNGVMLNYELATPITYTDLIYRDGGIDRPLSDVLLNTNVNNWSIEEQLITPYDEQTNQPTSIPATIKTQYGMNAVEAIDTLQKTCYFAKDVHANLQAMLTCINTNCAETLGGTFGISETATDKVFAFSFTPNVEPEP